LLAISANMSKNFVSFGIRRTMFRRNSPAHC
jgi:hypothetical protein